MKKRKDLISITTIFIIGLILAGCSNENKYDEQTDTTTEKDTTQKTNIVHEESQSIWSPLFTDLRECEKKDNVKFTSLPIDIGNIRIIEPLGELTDLRAGHITPGDHIGIQYSKNGGPYKLYAMADGYVIRLERQPLSSGFGLSKLVENYHIYFEYSCNLFGSYVHVTSLTPEIVNSNSQLKEFYNKPRPSNTESLYIRVPIKKGQVIGEVDVFGLLGILTVDTSVNLKGFVTPENYKDEPWKIHVVAPFDYFEEPIRSQLLEKNARKTEPLGGKIDFDVDGKLVGNWFLEGTDYGGNNKDVGYCGDYLCPYWDGHLSFVYDFVDPKQVRVSIGYDSGIIAGGPYGVKGNSPNPDSISINSGLVKYELVKIEDIGREFGFITEGKPIYTKSIDTYIVGTLLVQMLDNRKIKIEVFPDKTYSEVNGFTEKAKIYTR